LHLLSASPAKVRFGATHYQQHSAETSTLLNKLLKGYQHEGLNMPYTMEDFRKEYRQELMDEATPEERLRGLTPDQILPLLTLDQRLQGLSRDEIEEYLRKHKSKPAATKRKKRN